MSNQQSLAVKLGQKPSSNWCQLVKGTSDGKLDTDFVERAYSKEHGPYVLLESGKLYRLCTPRFVRLTTKGTLETVSEDVAREIAGSLAGAAKASGSTVLTFAKVDA